jgi:hypothetical protein
MAFTSLSNTLIQVGKAVKKEIFQVIKDNFDDHETRINNVEAGTISLNLFNGVVKPTSNFLHKGIAYYYISGNAIVTEAFIQIFEKDSFTGTLEIDILKSSTDNDDDNFVSIFTTKPSINFATAADFDESINQVLGSGASLASGDILRLDITAMPTKGSFPQNEVYPRFNIKCYGA